MNNALAAELIATYTANISAAEPNISVEELNLAVAAMLARYIAVELDPGAYSYHPHPNTVAEAIMHHAADYLREQAAAVGASVVVTPLTTHEVPAEALTDFAAFSAYLDSLKAVA